MTLIISWIGTDNKREGKQISSIYFASDSRYSWGSSSNYDYGIKVFGAIKYPEIFTFCGDVLFPSIVLGQIIPQIDNEILLNPSDNADTKSNTIFSYIETSFNKYPKDRIGKGFTILHATRFEKTFKLFKISTQSNLQLIKEEVKLPNNSTKVYSGGSGKTGFDNNWKKWEAKNHNNHGTSRAVYHCLHETLQNSQDPMTGGLPQIVGLFRAGNAKLFGIIDNERKYIFGKEISNDLSATNIEWRNGNFERMNPETLKILEGAQRQPS